MNLFEIYLLSVALGGVGILIFAYLDKRGALPNEKAALIVFVMFIPGVNVAVFIISLFASAIHMTPSRVDKLMENFDEDNNA